MKPSPEDSWRTFETSGRVQDYLAYRDSFDTAEAEEARTAEPPQENQMKSAGFYG